jgi:cell division protein FtsB
MVSRGFGELEAARRERRSLEAERSRLEHRVRVLQETLERLEEDPAATEALARRELGWVRPGETVIYLATPTPAAVAVPLTQPTPTPILSLR